MANKRRTFTRTNLSTFGADFGGIVRFNSNKFNPSYLCFVLDEVLQLKETPITNPIIHSSSKISFSNPLEIFHNNFASIKIINNFLADVMINPSHETSLFSRNLLQEPSGTLSAFALEFTSQELEFSFNLLNLGGMEELSIRSDSEIINPQVHTQNSTLRVRALGRKFLGECKQEEASAFFVNPQKALFNFPTEIFFIAIRNSKRNFNSSFNCGNAQNIILERSRTREIVSNRTELDYWIGFCSFNNSTGLLNAGNSQLTLQSHFSQFGVNKRMKLNIISNFHSPSDINTMLKSFLIEINCINNLLSWFNFNFGCYSNSHKNYKDNYYLNLLEGISPPNPKGRGIRNATFI